MTIRRDELLARIATLYYYQDLSQQEIAQQLGISRSNISRLLKEARDQGIVEIYIHHPIARNIELERQLVERFALRLARVVETDMADATATLQRTAQLAAATLDEALAEASTLSISWGTTVHATIDSFAPRQRYDVEVVQLMGGLPAAEPTIDGPALVQRLARVLTGRYRYLHAPLIVDGPEVAEGLLSQRHIAEALETAASAEVALVGIGALDSALSSLLRAGFLSAEEFEMIRAQGAVGDICGRHFNSRGQPVAPELDARLIAITLDQLIRIPTVIGAACSTRKATAICGALRGGYLDILVTDDATAEAVLLLDTQLERQKSVAVAAS
jgi:DNA-binding transcriptional regulator LsrR (DeoR family)